MPSVFDHFGGGFLTAEKIGKRRLKLRIRSLDSESLRDQRGAEKEKLVMTFHDEEMRYVMNVGNAKRLAAAWGEDYAKWYGKWVIATTAPTKYMGQDVLGVVLTAA